MRFLVDQDVYQVTIEWLRKDEHDVVTAKELGIQRATDEVLLRKAGELDRAFLTRDKDFGALVFLKTAEASGVILLRVTPITVAEVHRELQRLLREHKEQDLERSFCVVEPHRYRIRRLP